MPSKTLLKGCTGTFIGTPDRMNKVYNGISVIGANILECDKMAIRWYGVKSMEAAPYITATILKF